MKRTKKTTKRRVTIGVTQEDIDKGERKICGLCPVALAGQRAFPGYSIYVTWTYFHADALCDYNTLPMPEAAQNFVRDFDKGLPVQPLTFEVEV